MGWNDHVESLETECLTCGAVDDWDYWDAVGQQRYVGAIGELVGQDASKSGKCPHCGSASGRIVEDDE
jgi:Zn finger protein HypA/HybF involved in hydrogenase expression